MKTELQIRAEKAAERMYSARKPIVFEFAGVPKAGKTSTLSALQLFLKRCGFRVEVVVESASISPIRDKTDFNFNVWTACTTLVKILEKTQNPPHVDDPDILILDRGLFDAICWLRFMERLERIRPHERQTIESFLRMPDWRKRVSAVFVMTASPEHALEREQGLLPVEQKYGKIMNPQVLPEMLSTARATAKDLKEEFRLFEINTSAGLLDAKGIANKIADLALNVVEEHLREDILSIPTNEVTAAFGERSCLKATDASALADLFSKRGDFRPRENVEADSTRVQALPVVVVRNKRGDVLRLRRKERTDRNPLHDKIVIWAGGHVRKEDETNGHSLLQCALREIQEELHLSVEARELRLIGAVYSTAGSDRTRKHVAIVYEWSAPSDDVSIVLSSAEFFERRGTALSGTFIPLTELAHAVDTGKITEEWSVQIVRQLLATDYKFSSKLF
jgi:predicted NUDIX family phosphoesterase